MFRNSYQGSWLSLFYSGGSKPLETWDTYIKNGYMTRFLDPELRSLVFEIRGTNVSTNYMVCPKGKQTLGISMPYMIMIIKNLHKCFCFEVSVRDITNTKRRFRVGNFQSFTKVLPYSTVMPICLENGWNQVIFNLADFTRRAYGTSFAEVDSIKINANIRIKRIYFTVKLFDDSDLPPEYKLYAPPLTTKDKKKLLEAEANKENEATQVTPPPAPVEPTFVQEESPFPFPMRHRRSSGDPPPQKETKAKEEEKVEAPKDMDKEEKREEPQEQRRMEVRKRSSSAAKKTGQSLIVLKSRTSLQSNDTQAYSHQHSIDQVVSPLRSPSVGSIPARVPVTFDYSKVATHEALEEALDGTPPEEPVRGGSARDQLTDCGSNPLAIWDMEVRNGHVKRVTDQEVNSVVLEIVSTNVATTYISCPKNNQVLAIRLPFLVMIVKNLKRYFSFEITILDDKNMRRRFRISNFQSTTKIKPFCTTMPIGLSGGWNQIQFNLADFTRRAYGSQFIETLRVQVHANARLRRIYFSDRLYTEEELPQDYKLYLPLERKQKKKEEKKEEKKDEKEVKEIKPVKKAESKAAAAPAAAAPAAAAPAAVVKEEPKEVKPPEAPAEATTPVTEGAPSEGAPSEAAEGAPAGEAPAAGAAPAAAPAEGAAAPAEAPAEAAAAAPTQATPAEAPAADAPTAEAPPAEAPAPPAQ